MFVDVGYPSTSFAVYQPYIVEIPGMSNSAGSILVSIRNFSSLISIFFVGIYYKKLNCKKGIIIATLCTAVAFTIFALGTDIVVLSIASVVAGVGYSLGGIAGITILVDNWYAKNRGMALGISTMGSSTAGIFVPLMAVNLIQTFSLSVSFAVQAAIAFAICIIFAILIRNKPSDIGVKKFGQDFVDNPQLSEKTSMTRIHVFEKVHSKWQYRLIVLGVFFVGAIVLTNTVFLGILFTSCGCDPVVAAGIVAFSSLFLGLGKFFTGFLFDHLGTKAGTIVVFAILLVGCILLCMAPGQEDWYAYFASALFGVGASLATVGISKWSLDLASYKSRERTVRDLQAAYTCGGFAMGLIPGILFDFTGSYVPAFAGTAVMVVAAALLIFGMYPKRIKE